MSRSRDYAFTINNPVESDYSALDLLKDKAQYIIVGDEVGENGTPHLQCYAYFSNQKAFGSMKKLFPRAHIEVAKGSAEQNRVYCSKQKVLFECGEIPQQGKRNDIEEVREILKDNTIKGKMRAVTDKATSLQSIRMAEIWLKYHEKGREWRTEIRWFWGSSGAGKTYQAKQWLKENDGDFYKCMKSNKWWEGYDGQECVLIDEFRKNWCLFAELLDLLDENEYRVECKGGSRQLQANKIAITSCYHPEDVYDTREDVYQLIRRITWEGRYPERIVAVGDAVREKDKILNFED